MKSLLTIASVLVALMSSAQTQAVQTVSMLLQQGFEIVAVVGSPPATRILLKKGITLYFCEIMENPIRTKDCAALDR